MRRLCLGACLFALLVVSSSSGCRHDSLAIGESAVDQASTPDFAAAALGVACGTTTCAVADGCCTTPSGDPICAVGGVSMQCNPTQLWRCDGPEDCAGGTVCVGRGFSERYAQPRSSACEESTPVDLSQALTLCHVNEDCTGNTQCFDLKFPPASPPMFRGCAPWD